MRYMENGKKIVLNPSKYRPIGDEAIGSFGTHFFHSIHRKEYAKCVSLLHRKSNFREMKTTEHCFFLFKLKRKLPVNK